MLKIEVIFYIHELSPHVVFCSRFFSSASDSRRIAVAERREIRSSMPIICIPRINFGLLAAIRTLVIARKVSL